MNNNAILIKQSFSDYLSDKIPYLHQRLYSDAIMRFENDLSDCPFEQEQIVFKKEIPNSEFWKPSQVVVYYKENGKIRKYRKDLSPYWNASFVIQKVFNNESSLQYLPKDIVNSLEIQEINYVTGIATLHSRQSGRTFEINLNDAKNFKFDQLYTLDNTFINKLRK